MLVLSKGLLIQFTYHNIHFFYGFVIQNSKYQLYQCLSYDQIHLIKALLYMTLLALILEFQLLFFQDNPNLQQLTLNIIVVLLTFIMQIEQIWQQLNKYIIGTQFFNIGEKTMLRCISSMLVQFFYIQQAQINEILNYLKIFFMMYLLLCIVLRKNLFVDGIQCCIDKKVESELIFYNSDEAWMAEFTSSHIKNYEEFNLFTLNLGNSIVIFEVKNSISEYSCLILNQKRQKIDNLNLGLGAFQQIFLYINRQTIELKWYEDFKLILSNSYSFNDNQNIIIQNAFLYLCWQLIQLIHINNHLESCEKLFHINIKSNPFLPQVLYPYFNNNFYLIQFWLKIIEDKNYILLNVHLRGNLNRVDIFITNKATFFFFNFEEEKVIIEKLDGWIYFQLSYQRVNQIFQYSTNNNDQQFDIKQQFQIYQLKLDIKQHSLSNLMIHLLEDNIQQLCPPGCLSCEQNGLCFTCDINLLLIDGFCECQQNFNYLISPTECYNRLDYEIEKIDQSNIIPCPTYEGLECPQCYNQFKDQRHIYFIFKTNIPLQIPGLELEENFYYLLIKYKILEGQNVYIYYQSVDFIPIMRGAQNIILYYQDKYDIFFIGISRHEGYFLVHCRNSYVYSGGCKKYIKNCYSQRKASNCKQCQDLYFRINGLCKRCPNKCKICKIINSQLVCLKCVQNYFLNFQRQCIICELQYCQLCYHYQGQLNTLEKNFKTYKKGFHFLVGCSYCQDFTYLDLSKRICILQVDDDKIPINFQNKSYIIQNYQDIQSANCSSNCQLCFYQCLYCEIGYYLDIYKNYCNQLNSKMKNLYIQNQNAELDDADSIFSMISLFYYNYNYKSILDDQKEYLIKYCELLYMIEGNKQKIDTIYCKKNNPNDLTKTCPFYCNICYLNQTCVDYKYNILPKINYTLSKVSEITGFENENNYFIYCEQFEDYHYDFLFPFLNQLKITYLANNLEPYVQDLKDILWDYKECIQVNTIILELQNVGIENEKDLNIQALNQQIINSNISLYYSLGFYSNHLNFSLINVSIQGQEYKSNFQIQKQLVNFIFENVVLSSIKKINIKVNSSQIIFTNVSVNNLLIMNQDALFKFISNDIIIQNLSIRNCSFKNVQILFLIRKV